jgi:hypothetical protein
MKHIKKFNDDKINEEFFGGPLKDLMNPRVDELIEFLEDYKTKINEPNSFVNKEENRKVENMYQYIIHNLDLDALSKSNRQGDKVRGEGENFSQKVKRSIKNFESISEGKAEKASKNPFGNVTKEDKKDQLRKAVEDHIKDKECKTKEVGDDFEIHCDGDHIGQVMFRNNEITVKKKGEKFGKEFKYDELGKIKAEITSVIKDCCE